MAERATSSSGTPDRKKKMGRPEQFMKIDASPEEVAQAIFANAKPPDPSRRIHNQPKDPEGTG